MGSRTQVQSESECRSHEPLPKVKRYRFPGLHGKTTLQRFAEKCAFDPYTGCVMWIAGQTAGQGHNEPYGRFYDGERMVLAHRWSAQHIHGFDIDGLQVDHWCPAGPSTLCIEHVKPEPADVNRALQHLRPGRAFQTLEQKQFWVFVQKGIEPAPKRPLRICDGVPFFDPPQWLLPYMHSEVSDDCPF